MKVEATYPTGTCTGTDFVYGGFLAVGERVVNLQRDAFDLPTVGGLLCLAESTIEKIINLLGWPTPDQYAELQARVDTAQADADLLRQRLAEVEGDREEAIAALRAINRHTTKTGATAR